MSDADSPERIAADILIAMLQSGTPASQQRLAQTDTAVEAYRKLFKAVHHARTDDMKD